MNTITIPKNELRALVKESVREAFEDNLMAFRALLAPYVSVVEQKDVERRYRAPHRNRKATKSVEIEL